MTEEQRYSDALGITLYENVHEIELDEALRELKRLSSMVDVLFIGDPQSMNFMAMNQMLNIIDAIEIPMRVPQASA